VAKLEDCLQRCLQHCDAGNAIESYREATAVLPELRTQYINGQVNLAQRARGESVYFELCHRVQALLRELAEPPAEFDEINRKLADKYYVNMSVFQSLPDVWGIDQVFPIMPLQRLDVCPDRRAILHDLTCDSDGQVEYYVDSAGVETSLPVHAVHPGEHYLLGFFLVGAYQEILGDMHNLFGDTDAVNVELSADGSYRLRLSTTIDGEGPREHDYTIEHGFYVLRGYQARAEAVLRALGFPECRVRFHDTIARIEVPAAALSRLTAPDVRATVVRQMKGLGFLYVTVDLQGFRSGSLNEVLDVSKSTTPPRDDLRGW